MLPYYQQLRMLCDTAGQQVAGRWQAACIRQVGLHIPLWYCYYYCHKNTLDKAHKARALPTGVLQHPKGAKRNTSHFLHSASVCRVGLHTPSLCSTSATVYSVALVSGSYGSPTGVKPQ